MNKENISNDGVIKFINTFKEKYKEPIEYVFLHGHCYWFAIMLKERFNGEIYYVPVINHFITKINNKFYDVSGEFNNTYIKIAVPWNDYELVDKSDYFRIIRDCIQKF